MCLKLRLLVIFLPLKHGQGTVVIVNANKYSCDAPVVLPDRDLVHISLTDHTGKDSFAAPTSRILGTFFTSSL